MSWICRFRASYSSSFFNYIFSTYIPHTNTHTHTHPRTNEEKITCISFDVISLSLFFVFWRNTFSHLLLLSCHPPSHRQMDLCFDVMYVPFFTNQTSIRMFYTNVDASKFTASFTCHLFFDLLICNQIFLNYGFYGCALFGAFFYRINRIGKWSTVEEKLTWRKQENNRNECQVKSR